MKLFNKNIVFFFTIHIFFTSCTSFDTQVAEVENCEFLFQKLYDQQQSSKANNYSLDRHLESLLVEVSIGEEIMNSECFELFKDFEFETYGFTEHDEMSLYKNLICNLGFELANYQNYAFGRALDVVLDENKHCPIGEEFYQKNKDT